MGDGHPKQEDFHSSYSALRLLLDPTLPHPISDDVLCRLGSTRWCSRFPTRLLSLPRRSNAIAQQLLHLREAIVALLFIIPYG